MNYDDHPLTWTTTHGDVVELYSKTKGDGHGGTRLVWKWRRIHYRDGRVLAVSERAWPKKRRVVWEARRVNPPPPWWIGDEKDAEDES